MTRASPKYDPYRSIAVEPDSQRAKVTLPCVPGAKEGVTYTTVAFTPEPDGRGAHMRGKVKTRRRRG
jgi:hypothetical protein